MGNKWRLQLTFTPVETSIYRVSKYKRNPIIADLSRLYKVGRIEKHGRLQQTFAPVETSIHRVSENDISVISSSCGFVIAPSYLLCFKQNPKPTLNSNNFLLPVSTS